MKMVILGGGFGSDAGYWTIENGHLVHHGGWEINQLLEVSRSLAILGMAARLKAPGLAAAVAKELGPSLEKALTSHLGDQVGGGVVIVNVAGA
jgi:hypothetical protein